MARFIFKLPAARRVSTAGICAALALAACTPVEPAAPVDVSLNRSNSRPAEVTPTAATQQLPKPAADQADTKQATPTPAATPQPASQPAQQPANQTPPPPATTASPKPSGQSDAPDWWTQDPTRTAGRVIFGARGVGVTLGEARAAALAAAKERTQTELALNPDRLEIDRSDTAADDGRITVYLLVSVPTR